jgi:hypothetical protein
MLRRLYALAVQVLGAGSGAALPFAAIFLFGPEGFRHFAASYVVYALALFVGTLGLDLALARLGFAVWRSAALLACTTAVATGLLLWTDENLSGLAQMAVVCAAATGAASSFLVNKAYYLGDSATIARIGYVKIVAALGGLTLLGISGDPASGIYLILAQNAVVLVSTTYLLMVSNVQSAGALGLSAIPEHLGQAIASFLTFSFAGLLQSYERFLVARIDHDGVATYLTLSTLLSLLTYLGSGMERIEYSHTQDARRIKGTFRRLLLASLAMCGAIGAYVYLRQLQLLPLEINAVLMYAALAGALHTALYFSSAATVFRDYKSVDIITLARSNILQAIVPLAVLTTALMLAPLTPIGALTLIGLTVPTLLWWTSLLRMKRALSRSNTRPC